MSRARLTLLDGTEAAAGDVAGYSDDELMLLAGAGARRPFIELARRHQRRLLTLCIRSTGSVAQGEDLAQEVLVDLWRVAPRYQPQGRFLPFLYTLARNRLRSAARRAAVDTGEASVRARPENVADAGVPQPLDRLLASENDRCLTAALAGLDPRHRMALHLRYFDELSHETIAEVLDAPVGTVRSWVFYGLRHLRRTLEGEP